MSWTPDNDSTAVPTNTPLRVEFSDYPDPDSVGTNDFLLTTGLFYYTGTYSVDLRTKSVTFQPAGSLRTNLGYTLSVAPPLQSLSGCQTTSMQQNFRTGAGPVPTVPPPDVTFSDVQPIFAAHCAGAACHRQTADEGGGCLAAPAEGLSLCDANAVDALISVPSREVSRLSLVTPNDSSRSYLFRKLLSAAPGGGPIPTVLGQREPPGEPLSDEDVVTIEAWIESGARR